jgi:3-deoxy-D-manno-octulosonate 8-phosphate phosphatase (KDO 8-P phosphatase)
VKHILAAVKKKAAKIKLILLDVDGVLTDGGIIIEDRGVESKPFNVRDGQGITLLMECGIQVGFITGRYSNIVRRRAKELGVTIVYQRIKNKAQIYERIKRQTGLKDEQIAYVGMMLWTAILRKWVCDHAQDGWPGLARSITSLKLKEVGVR